MTSLGERPIRFAIVDFAALFALLAVVNHFVTPGDVGWFAVNPSPYLVVPVLLGVRYGFSAGLMAGLLTTLLLLLDRHFLSHGESLLEHRFTLVTYPLFGALVGQVGEGLRKRNGQFGTDRVRLLQENSRLTCERELLVLSRQDLQQRLGLFGADSASLDEELQELAETSREFAPAQLLAALERITRVRSAALYAVPEGRKAVLERTAAVGDTSKFPETLLASEHQIVQEAMEKKTFLIQRTLLDSTPSRSPGYLGAYPITGVEYSVTYVLVVQAIAFNDLKQNTFEVIKTICDWMRFTLATPLHQEAPHRAVNESDFFAAIEAALATHHQQAVPSILVRVPFDFADEVDPTEPLRELLEALPRTTILTNSYEDGRRSLLFLLPANPDPQVRDSMRSEFTAFSQKLGIGKQADPRFILTSPKETPQQLWGKLVIGNQGLAAK